MKGKNPQSKICLDLQHKSKNWQGSKRKLLLVLIFSALAVRLDAAAPVALIYQTEEFHVFTETGVPESGRKEQLVESVVVFD